MSNSGPPGFTIQEGWLLFIFNQWLIGGILPQPWGLSTGICSEAVAIAKAVAAEERSGETDHKHMQTDNPSMRCKIAPVVILRIAQVCFIRSY